MIDTSGSMAGARIQSVNNAMHELENSLREEARRNPTAQVNIRIITFGDGSARWHLADKTPVEQFYYEDINDVDGFTPMGSAFNILCNTLDNAHVPNRSLRPIVVLLSNGMPTDNYEGNLNIFNHFIRFDMRKNAERQSPRVCRDLQNDGTSNSETSIQIFGNRPFAMQQTDRCCIETYHR